MSSDDRDLEAFLRQFQPRPLAAAPPMRHAGSRRMALVAAAAAAAVLVASCDLARAGIAAGLGLDSLLVGVVIGYLAWAVPDDGIRADPVLERLAEREPDENDPRRYKPLRPS